MIKLGFTMHATAEELQLDRSRKITEHAMDMNLMLAELEFVVNDMDLAWKGTVPLLDVVRKLSWAIDHLSPESPQQTVSMLDYHEQLVVQLLDQESVDLYSEYTRKRAYCGLLELRAAVTGFGLRVLHVCYERYPRAELTPALLRFLPSHLIQLYSEQRINECGSRMIRARQPH